MHTQLHTEKTKRKMRRNHKGMLGKHHTKQTKLKIGEANEGRVPWIKGRPHTEITKEKLRKINKGVHKGKSLKERGHKFDCPCGVCKAKRGETKGRKLHRSSYVKHHIYLKENSREVIKLTWSKHRRLHSKVYSYVYDRFGKKGIDEYLKWFDKKFGLKDG